MVSQEAESSPVPPKRPPEAEIKIDLFGDISVVTTVVSGQNPVHISYSYHNLRESYEIAIEEARLRGTFVEMRNLNSPLAEEKGTSTV